MFVGLCSNQTEEVDDISVYDENFVDTGWGFRREGDPECASDEEIKDFLTNFKPIMRMFSNEPLMNYEEISDTPIYKKMTNYKSFQLSYDDYVYS